ncbi:MAG: hypothetical protein ABI175_26950 [Polyangiales bacterium]
MQAAVPPTRDTARKKKSRRGVLVLSIAGGVVVLFLVGFFLVLPRVVAAKVADAATRRALKIEYGFPTLGFSSASLSSVVISPRSTDSVVVTAPSLVAELSWFSPRSIRIPVAKVVLRGPMKDVQAAADSVREADKQIPRTERLPVDVEHGTLEWIEPLGEGSKITFDEMVLHHVPADDSLDALLSGGKVALPSVTLSPLSLNLTRRKGGDTHLVATLSEDAAKLDAFHDEEGDRGELTLKNLHPSDFDSSIKGLDLSKTRLDGTASYSRTADGAVRSKGNVTIAKLALPPIKIAVLSISLGTTLHLSWIGTPKKGHPGVMKIENGKLEIDVLGKTRVVTFTGEVTVGEEGNGPVLGKLEWATETFQCNDLSPLGGVEGTFSASGTLRFDLADLSAANLSPSIKQSCSLKGGGIPGLGDLLK